MSKVSFLLTLRLYFCLLSSVFSSFVMLLTSVHLLSSFLATSLLFYLLFSNIYRTAKISRFSCHYAAAKLPSIAQIFERFCEGRQESREKEKYKLECNVTVFRLILKVSRVNLHEAYLTTAGVDYLRDFKISGYGQNTI